MTPAEWEIMEGIWELGQDVSVRDVLEHLYPEGEKAYTTVQTVMNTLTAKKLLSRQKTGLVNFYVPTSTKEEVVKTEMSSLVSHIFGGSVPAMASSLMSLDDMSLEEIKQIKVLIDRKERQLKKEKA